ncbi:hypothetical protein SEUCBS139899_010566 [Sporothrix eucalyptigena]
MHGCCEPEFPVCQPDNFCCPEDTTACGAVNPAYCHYPGTICCPEPADTSCPDDTTCCGEEYCCEEGYECMEESICCLPGAVACESWCCPGGTECSEDEEGFCVEPDGETSAGSEPSQTEQSSIGEPSESLLFQFVFELVSIGSAHVQQASIESAVIQRYTNFVQSGRWLQRVEHIDV